MLKQSHEAGKRENSTSGKKNKIGGLIFECIVSLMPASAAMMANVSVSMVIGWIGSALFLVCILIQKEVLSEPSSAYGKIVANNESGLMLDVCRTSSDDFHAYTDACKDKGFTQNISQTSDVINTVRP